MDGISGLRHVEAGGFHAAGRVRAGDEKLPDILCPDEFRKGFAGQSVGLRLHNNLSAGTRTFKPGTKGAELVPELKIVSDHIFVKTKANALTSEEFSAYIRENGIDEFYITGADATGCVKSTCFNMTKAGYTVHVISDCVTSYDLKKLPEMLTYYADKGCEVRTLQEYRNDV